MSNVKLALNELNINNPHILEPSAGSGVFIDEFDNFPYDAYDIHPEAKNIKKADFFKKPTMINKIDRNYHLMKWTSLSRNSFKLGDKDYDVPSSSLYSLKIKFRVL